jgi:AAA15 family ATPase/GTPase
MRFAFPDNIDARTQYTQGMSSDEKHWKSVVNLIQFADLGISEARVRRNALNTEQRQTFEKLFRVMNADAPEEEINTLVDRATETVEFAHSTGVARETTFLPLEAESLGTQTLFALTGPVIRAISSGDTLFVDEIDASLHPRLTCEIISAFKDPKQNPKQAQIVFTSHDTTLLGGLLDEAKLARDEVWFTEKKADGATTLYPLTDFSPRKAENLERGYLQGRYGAVPYLRRQLLSEAITRGFDSSDATQADDDSETDLDMSHSE